MVRWRSEKKVVLLARCSPASRPPSPLSLSRQCTNCWWNPINSRKLQAELAAAGGGAAAAAAAGEAGLCGRGTKRPSSSAAASPKKKTPSARKKKVVDTWAQCDRCNAWRLLEPGALTGAGDWLCKNGGYACGKEGRRSAEDAAADAAAEAQSLEAARAADAANTGEWVQCERCDFWHALGPDARAADLPEHWFCEQAGLTCVKAMVLS